MKKKRKLYLCTIFPDEPTWQMVANVKQLQEAERIELVPIFIKAGNFSHRHSRHEPDKLQCLIRQQYLDKVPSGEWLLVLDSDEVLASPADNIADFLDYLDCNDMEVGMIVEFRQDRELKGRPRLIKKKQGLKYGTEEGNWKHDYIACPIPDKFDHSKCGTRNHVTLSEVNCRNEVRNYIDIRNNDTAMDLPIYFFHTKSSDAFVFDSPMGREIKHPEWVNITGGHTEPVPDLSWMITGDVDV